MSNRIFFSALFCLISFFCTGQTFTPDMDDTTTVPTFQEIFEKIVKCDGRIQGAMYITTGNAEITIVWSPKKISEDVYMKKTGDLVITLITPDNNCTRRVKLQADSEPKEEAGFNLQKQNDSKKRISRNFTCISVKE